MIFHPAHDDRLAIELGQDATEVMMQFLTNGPFAKESGGIAASLTSRDAIISGSPLFLRYDRLMAQEMPALRAVSPHRLVGHHRGQPSCAKAGFELNVLHENEVSLGACFNARFRKMARIGQYEDDFTFAAFITGALGLRMRAWLQLLALCRPAAELVHRPRRLCQNG